MTNSSWMAASLAAVLLVLSVGGCAPAGVKGVRAFEDLPAAEGEVMSDAEFFYELTNKRYCSTDDAYRGVLLFIDGKDTSKDFQERAARVQMHGIVKKSWKHNAKAPITKGKVAYMFARALEIRGGVVYNITDASPRYALRELIYHDIIISGSENQKLSGAEYVGILGRADDYREAMIKRKADQWPPRPWIGDY